MRPAGTGSALAAGFFLFQELPGAWTLAGAVVVVGSTLLITWREAYLARQPAT